MIFNNQLQRSYLFVLMTFVGVFCSRLLHSASAYSTTTTTKAFSIQRSSIVVQLKSRQSTSSSSTTTRAPTTSTQLHVLQPNPQGFGGGLPSDYDAQYKKYVAYGIPSTSYLASSSPSITPRPIESTAATRSTYPLPITKPYNTNTYSYANVNTNPTTNYFSNINNSINNLFQPQRRYYSSSEMLDSERYLFDLNGYIIVKNVLSTEEVNYANQVIQRHLHEAVERDDDALRNAVKGSTMYGLGPGRKDLGRILEWGQQESYIFASILNHPRLVPLFHGILGQGYRMDHLPFCILQDYGSEGFQLHGGTIDCMTGEYNSHLAYTCQQNTIRTPLLGCSVVLTDHNEGDGGFCIVPGSHKSNFQMPPGMVDGSEEYKQYIVQPVTQAGDVILFSEGTVHGALPWTPQNRQRRACLYRFAPSTNCYGRSYFGAHNIHQQQQQNRNVNYNSNPYEYDQYSTNTNTNMNYNSNRNNLMDSEMVLGWPRAMYEGLTDGQRAVLEPPYANRLDRPIIQERDTDNVLLETRNERKKQHDRDVFGTKYF